MPSTKPVSIRDANDYSVAAKVDPISRGLILIDHITAGIRAGILFTARAVNLAVAKDASLNALIRVPADRRMLLRTAESVADSATFSFYELTTFSSPGTLISAVNRNRSSSNVPAATINQDPTLILEGDFLFGSLYSGGVEIFNNPINNELLLPEGVYLAQLTNTANGPAKPLAIDLYWLEEETAP